MGYLQESKCSNHFLYLYIVYLGHLNFESEKILFTKWTLSENVCVRVPSCSGHAKDKLHWQSVSLSFRLSPVTSDKSLFSEGGQPPRVRAEAVASHLNVLL